MSFKIDEILGQETALHYISKYVLDIEKIPPLLIFYGPSSVGKLSLAERFSYQVLCENGTGCNQCLSCKSFMNHSHPDFIQFPFNENIAIGTDSSEPEEFTIRWLQKKRLYYKPHLSKKRIILVPDASLINNEAESALLKSLEEPPSHTRFIFIVDDLKKLKKTITSRAVLIPFQYLSSKLVHEISSKNEIYREDFFGGSIYPFEIPEEAIKLIVSKVENSISDSIELLKLEDWIYQFKNSHLEWEEDFNFFEFLEFFSTCLIYSFSNSELKNKLLILEKIFEFKNDLHKKIPGLETFLISDLFFNLTNLI